MLDVHKRVIYPAGNTLSRSVKSAYFGVLLFRSGFAFIIFCKLLGETGSCFESLISLVKWDGFYRALLSKLNVGLIECRSVGFVRKSWHSKKTVFKRWKKFMEKVVSFDVFGGCTSRDLFNYSNAPGKVNQYFARTSLVSQYTSKIPSLQQVNIQMTNGFRKSTVLGDLTKRMYDYFRSDAPKGDYFVMDLLVERLPILQYEEGYVTNSLEFKQAKIELPEATAIDKAEHLRIFESVLPAFVDDLAVYRKVFLNKSLFLNSYLDKENNLKNFQNAQYIARMNAVLWPLYDCLERSIPNLEVFDLQDIYAWEGHRWGLSPYHYEDRYYEGVNDKIRSSIG